MKFQVVTFNYILLFYEVIKIISFLNTNYIKTIDRFVIYCSNHNVDKPTSCHDFPLVLVPLYTCMPIYRLSITG